MTTNQRDSTKQLVEWTALVRAYDLAYLWISGTTVSVQPTMRCLEPNITGQIC